MRSRAKRKKSKLKKVLSFFFYVLKNLGPMGWFLTVMAGVLALNFSWQIYQKPTETLSLIFGQQVKSPQQTWNDYGSEFKENSTLLLSPTFLAALAQIESGGDPFASPPWQWNWQRTWKDWFAPISSSVGLYQFTRGTYEQARSFCIQNNQVVRTGQWFEWNTCWFNAFYMRFSPSDSIEMAASFLTHSLTKLLPKEQQVSSASAEKLAAIIHLCGEGVAQRFVNRLSAISTRHRCGTHSISTYLKKLQRTKKIFEGIAQKS